MLRKYSLVESYEGEAERSSEGRTLKLPVCVLCRLEEQCVLSHLHSLLQSLFPSSQMFLTQPVATGTQGEWGTRFASGYQVRGLESQLPGILSGSLSPLCPAKV